MSSIKLRQDNEWLRISSGVKGDKGDKGEKGDSGSGTANVRFDGGIQEWWVYPMATYLEDTNRTVFGSYSPDREIKVNELNHDTGEQKSIVLTTTELLDDHNSPALYAEPGRRMLMCWSEHNTDTLLRFRVSDQDGNINSFETNPSQNYNAPGVTSYAQVHKIPSLSNSDQDMFWVFSRIGNSSWYMLPVTVNQASGNITFGTPVEFLEANASKVYMISAPSYTDPHKIRIAWGFNPSGASNSVRYLEITTSNGQVYSGGNGSVVGNMSGTNLPLNESAVTPVLPQTALGVSRRLFYARPGPITPGIAYAEWSQSAPTQATYKVAEATTAAATEWQVYEYGIAGEKIGYSDGPNYISGISFPEPARSNSLLVSRIDTSGHSTLELFTRSSTAVSSKVVARSDLNRIARPVGVINAGPATATYSELSLYPNYWNFQSDIRVAMESFPSNVSTIVESSGASIASGVFRGNASTRTVTGLGFLPQEVEFRTSLGNSVTQAHIAIGSSFGTNNHHGIAVGINANGHKTIHSDSHSINLLSASTGDTLLQGRITSVGNGTFTVTLNVQRDVSVFWIARG